MEQHSRRSIRLRGYDYAAPGMYFLTICVQDRRCLFGSIIHDQLLLNAAGQMVREVWESLPKRFPMLSLDAYVLMPNHFHALITLDASLESAPRSSVGDIVRVFKSITTNAYIYGVHDQAWPAFDRRLWQRNYWERIVRDETERDLLYTYIETNPVRWSMDKLRPQPTSPSL
jgi:REP element-mobilizing transposase RayT